MFMWKIKKKINNIWFFVVSIGAILLGFFIQRDEKYVALGSWKGELYNDNSKYLAEYIKENLKDKKIVWVGNKKLKSILPAEYKFVKLGSLGSIPTLLRCKYMFFTQMHRADIAPFNVYKGAVLCLLDHGNTVKKWAMDAPTYKGNLEYKNFSIIKKIRTNIVGENECYRYITVASEPTKRAYASAIRYRMNEKSEIILTGTPRNDVLASATPEFIHEIKNKIAHEYGFDPGKKIVAYLPTFRRLKKEVETFTERPTEEMNRLEDILKRHNAIVLEKNHFAADEFAQNHKASRTKYVIKIDKPIDFQELLLIADIQIADYSGGFLDYTILDRPVIHYMYDYEEYKEKDSGLYYPAEEFAAGKIAKTFDEVLDSLEDELNGNDPYKEKRHYVRNTYLPYDDGNSAKKICEKIFGVKESGGEDHNE